MNDEFEIRLRRLFSEQREPLRPEGFMEAVQSRLTSLQRRQFAGWMAVVAILLSVAVVITPWVVRATLHLSAAMSRSTLSMEALLLGASAGLLLVAGIAFCTRHLR